MASFATALFASSWLILFFSGKGREDDCPGLQRYLLLYAHLAFHNYNYARHGWTYDVRLQKFLLNRICSHCISMRMLITKCMREGITVG